MTTAERAPPRLATCRTVTANGRRQRTRREVMVVPGDFYVRQMLERDRIVALSRESRVWRIENDAASRRRGAPDSRAKPLPSPAAAHTPAPPCTKRVVTSRDLSRRDNAEAPCRAERSRTGAPPDGSILRPRSKEELREGLRDLDRRLSRIERPAERGARSGRSDGDRLRPTRSCLRDPPDGLCELRRVLMASRRPSAGRPPAAPVAGKVSARSCRRRSSVPTRLSKIVS